MGGEGISEIVCRLETSEDTGQITDSSYLNENQGCKSPEYKKKCN